MDSEIKNLSIIIAMPSLLQQLFVIETLRKIGVHKVQSCITLVQADEALNNNRIDVVISSLYFDDQTSYPLLQNLNEKTNRKTPFLLLTAECSSEVLEPFRQQGAFAILKKPYQDNDLYLSLLDAIYFNKDRVIDSRGFLGNILTVDDSTMARCFVKRLLIKWGIDEANILEAENGEEALELIDGQRVSLVISDYNMPIMNGYDLLKVLRQTPDKRELPVIMVTSERDNKKLDALNALGVHCILDKPFSIIQLFHQMKYLSSRNRAAMQNTACNESISGFVEP